MNQPIIHQLDILYPFIQAPMFGVTTPEMVAAATETGCLGSLPLGDWSVEKSVQAIRATKALCNGQFAVNLFVHKVPQADEALKTQYAGSKQFIEALAADHGIEVSLPGIDEINVDDYHTQLDAALEEGCRIISFTFGNLDEESIRKCKDKGVLLIGTCTSVNEALILEQSGIDMICVQGLEAGGHRGSFATEDIPQIGGLSLLSRVYDSVKVPLIYAGGMYNARTVLAAKMIGASGFQVGTLLLNAHESALQPFERAGLKDCGESDIMLTRSFSGRYARGLRNTFIDAVEHSGHILPYPYQNRLTQALRKAARDAGHTGFVNLWAGQSLSGLPERSTKEILTDLVMDTAALNNEY
jgi:nitronate monooxygenase